MLATICSVPIDCRPQMLSLLWVTTGTLAVMPRPISTGNISFGLVSIPVKMYPTAESASSIRFNMLDGEDNSRVKQQYINVNTGELVPRDRMVKGYEFAKGQYVTFTNQELKAVMERASPSIEITEFVPIDEVPSVYFDKTYYLGPETGGERAYLLLSEAMNQTGRVAIARYAARGKQYLVMLRPHEGGVLMQQLYYADEVRSFADIPLGDEKELKEGELELAMQLIDQIANEEFDASKYEDEVRARTRAIIEQKVQGEEITQVEEEAPKAQIIDLMEALKASLASDESKDDESERKPAKRAKSSKKSASRKKAASG